MTPADAARPEALVAVRPIYRLRWPSLPEWAQPGERFRAYGGEVIEVDADGRAMPVQHQAQR